MDKYSILQGMDALGAPHIHLVEPGSRYGLSETADLTKTASHEHLPEVQELIESIKPKPNTIYLLNSALGAGEVVGLNLRGDVFSEEALLHKPPGWDKIPVWDIDKRRDVAAETEKVADWSSPLAWGFPTFYNAHRFRHHQNKDPNKAYGFILGAFWDPRMRRTILVSEVTKEQCEAQGASDLYQRLLNGDCPDTSMGAKVPFDVCLICGHRAITPADYCVHVRANAPEPFGMRKILADGRQCGVANPYPRFFDDSFVFMGACRSAKVMRHLTDKLVGSKSYSRTIVAPKMAREKVASATDEKVAQDKWAEMLKRLIIPNDKTQMFVSDQKSRMREIPRDTLKKVAGLDVDTALNGLADLGVVLEPAEFQYLVLTAQGLEKEAEALDTERSVFPTKHILSGDIEFPRAESSNATQFLLRQWLGDALLQNRSYAPEAIAERVTTLPQKIATAPRHARNFAQSAGIAEAYEHYRGALLDTPPQWGYPVHEWRGRPEKEALASAACEFSQALLLAHWL